ncbi:MAG: tripartite tricarboxylate transporter substrate binding protein [Rhodospirillales bacterium]|nr:tripartite tricarboxylate transporter substrate binding protein [Rhodospirillales bacterium]
MKKDLFRNFVAGIAAGAAVIAIAYTPTVAEAKGKAPKCSTARLIVPWKPGGGTHVLFSIFENTIQKLNVPSKLKVVTIPGQGGNKGAKEAAKAKPDGCTLFAIHQSAITSYLNGRINFTFPAFETVAQLTSTPDIVGASGQAPWNTFAELKKAATEKPGTILTGATFGSTSQFMWLLMEDLTGMKFKYVPFDGTKQRMTALQSNAIQLGTLNVASGRKYLENGTLKAYGIADKKRSKHMPNLPTMREQGVDLVFALKRGIVAPKGTPKDVIEYWADVLKQAAEDKDLLKQMDAKGTDINWVGPKGYRKWAEKTYKDYEKVAIKIGMYKK